MVFIKELGDKKYVFDNLKSMRNVVKISVDNEILTINYNWLIDSQYTEGNILSDSQEYQKLKEILSLGLYSKAPCGGFINFFKIKGSQKNNYVLFSGVNEVSNSHYIVTLHKLYKLI